MRHEKLVQDIKTWVSKAILYVHQNFLQDLTKHYFTREIYISHWLFKMCGACSFTMGIPTKTCKFFQADTQTSKHKTSLYLQDQNFTAHRMVMSDWAVLVTFRTYKVRNFGRTLKKAVKTDIWYGFVLRFSRGLQFSSQKVVYLIAFVEKLLMNLVHLRG